MAALFTLRRSAAFATVLTLALAACDGGSSPPTPSSMSASPSSVISGTVGQNVSISVTVTGSDGQPYAGGVVSFSVTSGGGTVSPTSATTNQSGRASATWTLGQTTGTQQLTASLGGVSTSFQADAGAGAPADIQAVSSFPGTYDPGSALPQAAVFEVEDQFGNKVSGATVGFSASDGGAVNPAQGTTDTQGRASTTWTLGPNNGTQTLSATVGSVSPAAVTAEAYDPCQDVQSLTLGGTVTGNLSGESCETEVDNTLRFLDWYGFNLQGAGAYVFTVTSDFSNPSWNLWDSGGYMGGFIATTGNTVVYRSFLDVNPMTAPGNASAAETYLGGIFSQGGGVGAYEIAAVASSGQIQGCENWITSGEMTTTQTLEGTECTIYVTLSGGTEWERNADRIYIYLQQGEAVAISETSTTIDTYLYVFDTSGNQLAANDDVDLQGGNTNSYIEFTAPERGYYRIYASTFTPKSQGGVGSYTLTITPMTTTSPQAVGGVLSPRIGGAPLLLRTESQPAERVVESGNGGKGTIR